jgi:hypothetical protein
MSEVSIFKQGGQVARERREPTELGKTLTANSTMRRLQTNVNGTFKRIINGEQIGDAIRGEIDVIIIAALPAVSRVYYEAAYDPNATPTLPDCWSNLGDKPEAAAGNRQATSCALCPQNVKGSADNGGRACRYQRRLAVLVPGDPQKDIYQLNIPAKSLFGKGVGNTMPFEQYNKFLVANGESADTVVTNVAYNLNADTMELVFTPMRQITDAEYQDVIAAQANPDAQRYTIITAAQADGVVKQPKGAEKAQEQAQEQAPTNGALAQPSGEETGVDEPPEAQVEPQVAARGSRKGAVETPAGAASLAQSLDDWTND